MARILKQFESTVLGLVAADPHSKTGNVNFLSDSDQDDIKEWNATMPEKRHECMHVCIDRIAEKRPFSPAICAWDGELSYRELEQHASALAQHLHITFHLVPDEVVLLHFEKSMWTAVCMYAVQKAGCAYGFLGLTDPIARMNTIVKTTKSRVVLTSSTLQDRFSQMPVDVVVVNQSLFDNMQTLASGFQVDVQPSNLAYILFTSGSTGVPKAVMVDHAAGTTSAYEHGTAEGVTADCRVLQFASYTFDVSTSETLTTLIMGGCVCIPSEEDRLDDLAGCLNHFGVNHTFLTPTVVSLLEPEDIPDVKTLKLGGEALTRENVAIWADKVQLSNSYGVCEAAIRSCFRNNITPDTDFSNCGSAVGCALWVTDPNNPNLLAHIGALGELIIEGPTLALGYMGDAQKTAEAFIEPVWLKNMFPGRPCRVYRTGDIVRYAEDGTIRFVGRSDSQVKINGQRVELREIEHHIMVMAREGLAAVVLPKKGSYKGKLVGLLAFTDTLIQDGVLKRLDTAAKPEQTNTFRELERTLIDVLPGYMVPRSWVAVEGLPINLSGKMNRLLLQDWVDGL
ncbi:acetyl-CoA synthetase-like protein [Xylariaceae sp. AK1471]|nr:acetyl-CoA synthetase-like protein [Xylariaceae sp. AK1471]